MVLWNAIIHAKGFHKSFSHWAFQHGANFLPLKLPDLEFARCLTDAFVEWHAANTSYFARENRRIRYVNRLLDIQQGGKQTFRAIADEPPPPLQFVHFPKEFTVVRQKWPKTGKHQIILEDVSNLRLDAIRFQGQEVCIKKIEGAVITVDKPLRLRSSSLVLTQDAWTIDHDKMHNLVNQEWDAFFQRDSRQENEFHAINQYLEVIKTDQIMKYHPISVCDLKQAIASTSKLSARGGDGFTTLDLSKVPEPILQMLSHILCLVEHNKVWPHRWVIAKTLCLTKGHSPTSPLDIRPITILSKVYRLWSKIRGKQLANFLTANLPRQIGGPSLGISSEMIALLNAELIEEANITGARLSGVVLDLIKAYNTVPRDPLVQVLLIMGADPTIVGAFLSAMDAMHRVFIIDGTAGQEFTTTTGIVEGCSFAVPAMLAISIWAWKVLLAEVPDANCLFFADNWSFVHADHAALLHGLDHLNKFLNTIKMQLSKPKSWLWSNNPEGRQYLRQDPYNLSIPMHEAAKDLGVQQNYTRKRRKPQGALKIRKTIDKCKKISQINVPNHFRQTMTVAAAHSKHTYGAAVSIMSRDSFGELRTATAQAIKRSKGGSNPYLACNAIEPLDPEYKDIVNRLICFRRYLRTFPHRRRSIENAIQATHHSYRKATGPCVSLGLALDKIKCTPAFQDQAFGIDTPYGFLHVEHTSAKLIKYICRHLWNDQIPHLIHRKDFHQAPFDFEIIHSAFGKLNPSQQAPISAYITGKRMTQDASKVFRTDITGQCPFCEHDDSRIHRIYYCPQWHEQRVQAHVTFESSQALGTNMPTLGLPDKIDLPFKECLGCLNCALPFAVPEQSHNAPLLFLDGTAFCSTNPITALAGAAVVQGFPDTLTTKLILRTRVVGIAQNSYTAEVFAILLALNHAWHATLFSDCQTAVDQFNYILLHHALPDIQPGYHHVWALILRHLNCRNFLGVSIQKVKAHEQWSQILDANLRFQSFANSQADYHAKAVFLQDNKSLLDQHTHIVDCIQQAQQQLDSIYQFVAAVWVDSINAYKKKNKLDNQTRGRIQSADVLATAQLKWAPCSRSKSVNFDIDLELCKRCPYHPIFCFRLLWWAKQLHWCGPNCSCSTRITFAQLYLDFSVTTKSIAPVNMAPGKARSWKGVSDFRLQDVSKEADAKGPQTLAAQSKIFILCLKWLHAHGVYPFGHDREKIDRTDELNWIGIRGWFPALKGRPKLASGFDSALALDAYLKQASPPSRHFNLHWRVSGLPVPQHPESLNLSFDQIVRCILDQQH